MKATVSKRLPLCLGKREYNSQSVVKRTGTFERNVIGKGGTGIWILKRIQNRTGQNKT